MRVLAAVIVLSLAGCATPSPSLSPLQTSVECAIYAREVTGLLLYGDAADWWEQAATRYPRGRDPAPGRVLVFRRAGRLPHGHVSVVLAQVSAREIRVEQANWVHGRVTRDDSVIDVSPANDWSEVRVWWEPAGAMGSTIYHTFGFVGPGLVPLASSSPMRLASGPVWAGDQARADGVIRD